MTLLEFFLVVLPVGGMVFIAGCGFLDMAETALRAWRRRARAGR